MLKKIMIFCFIVYSIFFVTVKFYVFPFYNKPTALFLNSFQGWRNLENVKNIDYLITGDSMALCGISPTVISGNSYSIAMPAASMMDIYYLLKKTDLSHVNKGIIISNSFFFEKNYEEDYWEKMIQLGFYDFSEFFSNYQTGKENKIFPYTRYSKIVYFYNYLKFKTLLNSVVLEAIDTPENATLEHKNSIEKMKERMIKGHGFISYSESLKAKKFFYAYILHFNRSFYPSPTDDFYLKKILELTRNQKVYFIQLPLAEDSHPKIKVVAYKTGLENYIMSLTRNYPHLQFYTPKIKFLNKDFYNFYNLNSSGAKKLSNELKEYFSKID
jgi:hypothetical protein